MKRRRGRPCDWSGLKYLFYTFAAVPLFLLACAAPEQASAYSQVEFLTSPAGDGSAQPGLAGDVHDTIFLSWIEPGEKKSHALRFSSIDKDMRWTPPQTISSGDNWFVNWADVPALSVQSRGWLAAHWLARSGEGTYAYHVNMSQSIDGGKQWSSPFILHHDRSAAEHGFVSMAPWNEQQFLAVWLDGQAYALGGEVSAGTMVRAAFVYADGSVEHETLLDDRACDCCPTASVRTAGGLLVAYRDRSVDEVRDISIVRYSGSAWSEPSLLSGDGWVINGCPVNGPALAARGNRVAAAWFTAAAETARVNLSLSADGGRNWLPPQRIDGGNTIGRVGLAMLDDGTTAVVWIEIRDDRAELRLRVLRPGDVSPAEPVLIANTVSARSSGYPRIAAVGDRLIIAWTDLQNELTRVRIATVK